MPAPRSARSPSVKARKYVAGVLAGKSKKQAARDAGYTRAVAKNPGQKIDQQPGVQDLFRELLRQAGATDALLARRIREGLDATWVARETLYAKREVLTDFEERRQMAELVCRLQGRLHSAEAEPQLHLHLHQELESRLTEARRLAALSESPATENPARH